MTYTQLSIVIPAFNREKTIERAIKSVASQSDENTEIIVVDDGSSDQSAPITKALSKFDNRLLLFQHKFNRGAQAARNTGARHAKGQWILFLDSDDYLLPNAIQRLLGEASKGEYKVVHSECNVIRNQFIRPFGIPAIHGRIYKQVLQKPAPMFQGMLIHRQALEKIGYLDEEIISYQEWDTAIRLAQWFEFGFVSEPTFVYDCRGLDTISKNMIREAQGYRQVVTKHARAIVETCGRRAMANHCTAIASKYKAQNMRSQYLHYKLSSLAWWPPLALRIPRRLGSRLFK